MNDRIPQGGSAAKTDAKSTDSTRTMGGLGTGRGASPRAMTTSGRNQSDVQNDRGAQVREPGIGVHDNPTRTEQADTGRQVGDGTTVIGDEQTDQLTRAAGAHV